MAASAARTAAFRIALRVDRDAAYADELLHSVRMTKLESRECAFVTELVMGSLRRRGELDDLISRQYPKPLRTVDPEVLTALPTRGLPTALHGWRRGTCRSFRVGRTREACAQAIGWRPGERATPSPASLAGA